jgi:uncharacterized protein YndB with AHSA1/START domain
VTGIRSELRSDPAGSVLVLRRTYPDPVDEVWAAITESDRLARWAGSYTGTGRVGGTVEVTWTGEVDAGGEVAPPVTVTIHECRPPHRLVVELPQGDSSWVIAVTLAPDPERPTATLLTFEQQLPPDLPAADVEAGWSWYLDRLGASLSGRPMPSWDAYAPSE